MLLRHVQTEFCTEPGELLVELGQECHLAFFWQERRRHPVSRQARQSGRVVAERPGEEPVLIVERGSEHRRVIGVDRDHDPCGVERGKWVGIGMFDAVSGGNLLNYGDLDTPRTVGAGAGFAAVEYLPESKRLMTSPVMSSDGST